MGLETAKTSLNQIPALHKKVLDDILEGQWKLTESQWKLTEGQCILDYGCGRYDKGLNYIRSKGHVPLGYDVYNRPTEDNETALLLLNSGMVDVIFCANVLNVCTYEERKAIYRDLKKAPRVYISVYQGTGTGIRTGNQENLKINEYLTELKKHFRVVERKGQVIKVGN